MTHSQYIRLEEEREELVLETLSSAYLEETLEYQSSISEQIDNISDKLNEVTELDYEGA